MTELITVTNDKQTARAAELRRIKRTTTPEYVVRDCQTCGPQQRYARVAGSRIDDASRRAPDGLLKLHRFGITSDARGLVIFQCPGCRHLEFYFNPEVLAPPEPEPVTARPAAAAPAPTPEPEPPGPKVDPIDL